MTSRPIEVTAAIFASNGRVLIARRAAGKHLAGYWEFPGGKLEIGESPEVCLARELEEEFGIKVSVGEYLAENIHDYGDKVVKLMAFYVEHLSGEFGLTDHDAIKWVTRAEFDSIQLAPADVPLLEFINFS